MTTSQDKPFLSTLLPKERPPAFVLGYLASEFVTRLHERVLSLFLVLETQKQISKAEIARRLNKDPALINRWLSGPGNWELRTVSDLSAAMGYRPEISFVRIGTPVVRVERDAPSLPSKKESGTSQNDDVFDPDRAFNKATKARPRSDQRPSVDDLGLRATA